MRPVAMALWIGGMLAAPSLADIGEVMLDIKSGGADQVVYVGQPSIPIEVYFSATTSGTSGPNNGVQGIFMDIQGSALVGAMQSSLTPDPVFTDFAFSGGLGFDLFPVATTGGTGAVGLISGVGNAQATPGSWSPVLDAADVGHAGNVLVATGTLTLGPGAGIGDEVTLTGASNLWDIDFLSTQPAATIGDTLPLVIPEPASLMLLAPAGLALLRRRRKLA